MRRRGWMLVLVLATAGLVSPADAAAVGVIFHAPYERSSGIGASSVDGPCDTTSNHLVGLSFDSPSGRLRAGEGISALDCVRIAQSLSGRVRLGSIPEPLVGRPGEIVVTLTEIHAVAAGEGNAADWRASATFSIFADETESSWPVASLECAGTSCETSTRPDGLAVLRAAVPALPATLHAGFGAAAALTDGGASFGAGYEAVLAAVVVRPL